MTKLEALEDLSKNSEATVKDYMVLISSGHYEVRDCNKVLYFFTTTTRTLENCIELMKEKFSNTPTFKLYRNGELVYRKAPMLKVTREVFDVRTGETYKSVRHFCKVTKIARSTARDWLTKKYRLKYA
jgi:hypothetical protein